MTAEHASEPIAPEVETVEALAKALRDLRDAELVNWDALPEQWRKRLRSQAADILASPAMRDLLAATARAAEGQVVKRVEAAGWDHEPAEATGGYAECMGCDWPTSRAQYESEPFVAHVVRAALRASEADRG